MIIAATVLILTLLTLFQVNVVPLNLAFVAICALFLFSHRDFSFWWLVVLGVLLSLFANLNLGLVVIGLTLAFLVVDLGSRLFPDNRLVKASLLVVALFLSEYLLISLGKVF